MAEREGIDCTYHSRKWRSRTQAILNILREYVNASYLRRFPRVVCTCKEREDVALPDVHSDTLREWLDAISSKEDYSKLVKQLKPMLSATRHVNDNKSLHRTVTVIYQVLQGNVSFLKPPPSSTEDLSPAIATVKDSFMLDLPAQHVGLFFGAQGIHLKNLCKKYSITDIHFGKKEVVKHCRLLSPPFSVSYEYKAEDSDKVKGFQQALYGRADNVQNKLEKHHLAVRQYRVVCDRRRELARDRLEIREALLYDNPKESAQVTFDTKSRHTKERKKKHPALAGSHCRQCLMPFTQGDDDTSTMRCKYHPGYIVAKKNNKARKVWSCCRRSSHTDNPSFEEHSGTGCWYGRHQWRLHSKKGKSKTKLITSDDLDV